MKKTIILTVLLCTVFVCGCDDLKTAMVTNGINSDVKGIFFAVFVLAFMWFIIKNGSKKQKEEKSMGILEQEEIKKNGGYICTECCSIFSKLQICKSYESNLGCIIIVILFLTIIGGIIWLIIESTKDKTPKFIPCPKCGAINSYLLISSPKGKKFIEDNNLEIK